MLLPVSYDWNVRGRTKLGFLTKASHCALLLWEGHLSVDGQHQSLAARWLAAHLVPMRWGLNRGTRMRCRKSGTQTAAARFITLPSQIMVSPERANFFR